MSVTVCFSLEEGNSTFSQNDFNNQWSYVLEHFHYDKIYVVGNDAENSIFAYKCFTNGTYSLVNSYNDITENLVYITPQNSNFAGTVNLKDYTHPADNVCYVFGTNNDGISSTVEGDKVYIDAHTDLPLYNWVACAVVGYDRSMKIGNS